MITQERLKELVKYDEVTGLFTWLVSPKHSGVAVGDVAGCIDRLNGYVKVQFDSEPELGHRMAWLYMTGELPNTKLDHKDTNRSNNAWLNLRPASSSENGCNRKVGSNSSTGVKGVSIRSRNGKFKAAVKLHGVRYYLGDHDTIEAASDAVRSARTRLHGEFANHGDTA